MGSYAAKFLHEAGAKVVAVAEYGGGFYNPEGMYLSSSTSFFLIILYH